MNEETAMKEKQGILRITALHYIMQLSDKLFISMIAIWRTMAIHDKL